MSNNKVIVIEDDPDINKLITYALQKEGFAVEQVFDGNIGAQRLKSDYFNIVVLDIMLPGLSGYDICKEIKEKDSLPKPFVIVISAKSSYQDKLYAHILGADCYLSKPFRVGKLTEIVNEIRQMQNKNYTVKLVK